MFDVLVMQPWETMGGFWSLRVSGKHIHVALFDGPCHHTTPHHTTFHHLLIPLLYPCVWFPVAAQHSRGVSKHAVFG
jgi:hypothetical protein